MPLPGSTSFEAELDLAKLGSAARRATVTKMDPFQVAAKSPQVSLTDGVLRIEADAICFAYRIVLGE